MSGAVPVVTERTPSLRISLRKRTIIPARSRELSPPPRPVKTKGVSKKRAKSTTAKPKPQPVVKTQTEGKPRSTTKGKKTKHSRPWEVDDGDERPFDYVSRSDSESSSSEEESTLRTQSFVFLEDEQDADCITNDDYYQCSEEDTAECSRLPWIDLPTAEIPPLVLPESSKDIPVPSDYLLDTLELYELLRSYWRTLRLTPFLFEDFCAALSSPDNSCLLSEIHIVLLKICFKNDEEEQVHFSGNDTNNAYNIVTACLEPMTYAEVLRQYLSCDATVPVEVMDAINTPNYPFVDFSARLVLITFLCYRFLYSYEYKKIVVATSGRIEHEETCRSCSKSGEVIPCDTCEAVFHLACVDLEVKPEQWVCELCEKSKVKGVQDCLPLEENLSKQPLRMEPIGRDRHGRFYWFVARRIFVHNIDESDLRYYSTAPQFYQLVKLMDPSFYEFDLCNVFFERLSDILEQMSVTLEISSDRRDTLYRENYGSTKPLPAEVYLQQENMQLMAEILTAEGSEAKAEVVEEESSPGEEKPITNLIDYFKTMLGMSHGRLVNNFWSGNVEENELLQYYKSEDRPNLGPSDLFRMGCPSDDAAYSQYKNLFVEHKYGEHPSTKRKAVDKKKYLCSKFSLMEEGEWAFEWSTAKGHNLFGSERLQTLYVAWTIGKLLRKVPIELMHRKWKDALPAFKKELDSPNTSWQTLRDLLLRLECGMRRTLFLPQWWNSLGHTRLTRTTVEEREHLMKEAQRRKKDEREAADALDEEIIVVKYTKLPHGISRELTRMRDEKYRVYGRGELGGWIWFSRTLVRDIRNSSYISLKLLLESPDLAEAVHKKRKRLDVLISRFKQWRSQQEVVHGSSKCPACYSPSCRMGIQSSFVCSDDLTAGYQQCYSQECRQNSAHSYFSGTSGIVKAFNSSKIPERRKGVLGEDLPWPLPEVNKFVSRGSKRTSIFVLPQVTLRKLAKTGGRKAIYVPSFSVTAKGNFQYWNYPASRPCFDLCWRWLTVNCSSLHAVALQLRILWASIRWMDLKPEDDDPDRRVVTHFPDRDERRWISLHKEYAPPCIYERYRLSIEVLPLDDDKTIDEEDDVSWNTSERERRRSARRRKPQMPSASVRRITQIKEEWVDGVDLKLYEIYDYWRGFSDRFNKPQTRAKQAPSASKLQSNAIEKAQSVPAQRVPQPTTVTRPQKVTTAAPATTSIATNAVSMRKAAPISSRVRLPPPRHFSTPTSEPRQNTVGASMNESSTRKIQTNTNSVCYPATQNDKERLNSERREGSERNEWRPLPAKRPRFCPRMESNRLLQTLAPTSRTLAGRPYQVGYIRGGGRTATNLFSSDPSPDHCLQTSSLIRKNSVVSCDSMGFNGNNHSTNLYTQRGPNTPPVVNIEPVGEDMQPAALLEESVVPLGAEETIVTSDVNEEIIPTRQPPTSRSVPVNTAYSSRAPIMSRYSSGSGSYNGRAPAARLLSNSGVMQPSPSVSRSSPSAASGSGKVLMVRRSDGTTQFLRQIPQPVDEYVSATTSSVRSRASQSMRSTMGSRLLQTSSVDQDRSTSTRHFLHADRTGVRSGYEPLGEPLIKRMAVGKGVTSHVTSQGMIRRQFPRSVDVQDEVYYEPVVLDEEGVPIQEEVVYSDQGGRIENSTVDRFQPVRYGMNSPVPRVVPKSAAMIGGARVPANSSSQRVYYVKNPKPIPTRVLLAPEPMEYYAREEIVYNNDDYIIDEGEVSNHSGMHVSSDQY